MSGQVNRRYFISNGHHDCVHNGSVLVRIRAEVEALFLQQGFSGPPGKMSPWLCSAIGAAKIVCTLQRRTSMLWQCTDVPCAPIVTAKNNHMLGASQLATWRLSFFGWRGFGWFHICRQKRRGSWKSSNPFGAAAIISLPLKTSDGCREQLPIPTNPRTTLLSVDLMLHGFHRE